MQWLVESRNGEVLTEQAYPYRSGGGDAPPCDAPTGPVGSKITGYKDIGASESDMSDWMLTGGPIAISVDATSWQSYALPAVSPFASCHCPVRLTCRRYQGGIMTDCDGGEVDHAVLAVGFNADHSTPYWIVKNSWATSWGEDGTLNPKQIFKRCTP